MIVAMQDHATDEQIQSVIERMVELGFNVHRTTGETQTILAGVGTLGGPPGVSHLVAVQACRARLPARGNADYVSEWRGCGRRRSRHHGGAVLGGKPRTDSPERAAGCCRRSAVSAWWSIQAAQLAVQLPGPGA
jgi:hypothetical protein